MDEAKDKPRRSIFSNLVRKRSQKSDKDTPPLELTPAMPELGNAPCPVCGQKVAVFVTRTKRPFINCGFCSARIFYNGSRSMQILQKQIKGSEAKIVPPSNESPTSSVPLTKPYKSILRGSR
jgi:DNA-directed RNA polymerase subunit RPC12/RpoP